MRRNVYVVVICFVTRDKWINKYCGISFIVSCQIFLPFRFTTAHLAYLKKKNAKKKKKEKNVQAHCVEPVHPVPINIEETGWNQNTEGPYYGGNAGRIDL